MIITYMENEIYHAEKWKTLATNAIIVTMCALLTS